ncbi:MAG: hypothetical protein U9Q07_12515, partial [Planctomycetota bacterium]|nr:hypothetical protein [Planctomycetota bacterium]
AALVLMFVAMRKLFGTLSASVGVIIASIYLSAPVMAKFGNVKEQHMIAFMILGVSCFVLYQLNGKRWCSVLAGAFLCCAPLFKETGVSAIGGVGLFVIAQPLLKHCSWKKTGTDILLLLAGAATVICPISLWLAVSGSPINYYPYSFLYRPVVSALQGPRPTDVSEAVEPDAAESAVQETAAEQGLLMKLMPAYVRDSWQIMTPDQRRQARLRVFRWYGVLILPIALAVGAIIARIIRMILGGVSKSKDEREISHDRFALLFAVWWLLDMTFVWISPRSYEQYYLPLNASAAMLSGYLVAVYSDKAKRKAFAPQWLAIGAVGLVVMLFMSLHIFRGLAKSPHSGTIYTNFRTKLPERRNGYAQKWAEVSQRRRGLTQMPWEVLAQHIKANSTPDDRIYVWGWWPGIYVQAQRLSPAPKAFEGTMHTLAPSVLSERVAETLNAFEEQPPKFVVDSYKTHFPWDRPPLELWLGANKGFKPANEQIVSQVEAQYVKMLAERVNDPDEIKRFEAMKPFRDYVMNNYRIVRSFGKHVLFQRK